jgi:hypothetical protein
LQGETCRQVREEGCPDEAERFQRLCVNIQDGLARGVTAGAAPSDAELFQRLCLNIQRGLARGPVSRWSAALL